MRTMALEVAPFCTRVLAPFYLRVSSSGHDIHQPVKDIQSYGKYQPTFHIKMHCSRA